MINKQVRGPSYIEWAHPPSFEQKKATSHLDDRRRRLLRVHAAQTRRSHIGRYVMQTVQIET